MGLSRIEMHKMTRKDFELIAGVVEKSDQAVMPISKQAKSRIATFFAQALTGTNPRFDKIRFLKACGVED